MTNVQRILVSMTALGIVISLGCPLGRPSGASRVRGGSTEMFSIGRMTTLNLDSPEGQVVVVVLFPKPIDESWHPGFGHSGNGDDVTHWEELYKVRFQNNPDPEILTIKWTYSTRTAKLRIGDVQCDLPKGKVAVISHLAEAAQNRYNLGCEMGRFRPHENTLWRGTDPRWLTAS